MGIFAGDDADFAAGAEEVRGAANQPETVFAQPHAQGEFRGEAVVAEFPESRINQFKVLRSNEIAQRLHIPRKEMKIGFCGIKSLVSALFFEGNVKQQFAAGFQNAAGRAKHLGGVFDVLENVMADYDVGDSRFDDAGAGNKFHAVTFQFGRKEIFEVGADAADAFQFGEIPTEADAEFDDGVAACDQWLKFFGAQSLDPRSGCFRNRAFLLLITLSCFTAIMIFGRDGHWATTSQRPETNNSPR